MPRELIDSGVEWIGKIPSHWKLRRIDTLFSLRSEKVSDNDFQPLSVTKSGILLQLDYVAKSNAHDDRKLVKKGDFVINSRSDRRGSCGVSEYDGSVSLINLVLTPKSDDTAYSSLLFCTTQFADEFYRFGHGIVDDLWTTGWPEMRKIVLPLPPKEEQKRISSFLNKKCSCINSVILNLKKEISELDSYRRTLVSETIVNGIHRHTSFKDSGMQWVGKIPFDWKIHPVYMYFSERKRKNVLLNENNLLSLSYGKIIRKDINTTEGLLPESFSTYNIVEKGDIIIRPTDLQNDKRSLRTGLCDEHGIITSAYIALRPKEGINYSYYNYLLYFYDIKKVFYNMGNGVRQCLSYDEFSKLLVLEPSKDEQEKIVKFLDKKCDAIDRLIKKRQKQVDILEEYKKSIIFEYVTGKKETPYE